MKKFGCKVLLEINQELFLGLVSVTAHVCRVDLLLHFLRMNC